MNSEDHPPPVKPQVSDRGWRITLYALLSILLLAVLLRVGFFLLPNGPFWISSLQYFGLASFLGLYLWIIESVESRPVLTRFALRCILAIGLVWITSPILKIFQKSDLGAKRHADVTRIFHELVAEGKLPAPVPVDAFTMTSRHGTLFHIRYEDSNGATQNYFVSDGFERFWKFKNMTDNSEIKRPAAYLKKK